MFWKIDVIKKNFLLIIIFYLCMPCLSLVYICLIINLLKVSLNKPKKTNIETKQNWKKKNKRNNILNPKQIFLLHENLHDIPCCVHFSRRKKSSFYISSYFFSSIKKKILTWKLLHQLFCLTSFFLFFTQTEWLAELVLWCDLLFIPYVLSVLTFLMLFLFHVLSLFS